MILYYFLLGTADNDNEVHSLAMQIIESQINVIHPKALSNNIIEIMVLLNGCTYLPIFKAEDGIDKYKPIYNGSNPDNVLYAMQIH